MFWRRGQRERGPLWFACLRAACSPKKYAEGREQTKKTRLRAVSRKPRVSLCGELFVKNEYGQEFTNACDYRGYSADVRAYGKNERVLNVSADEGH